MKALIFTLILIGVCFASNFCAGFKAGYKAGYCHNKGYGCIQPINPICPVPRIGENSYMGGYDRGFLVGLSRGR